VGELAERAEVGGAEQLSFLPAVSASAVTSPLASLGDVDGPLQWKRNPCADALIMGPMMPDWPTVDGCPTHQNGPVSLLVRGRSAAEIAPGIILGTIRKKDLPLGLPLGLLSLQMVRIVSQFKVISGNFLLLPNRIFDTLPGMKGNMTQSKRIEERLKMVGSLSDLDLKVENITINGHHFRRNVLSGRPWEFATVHSEEGDIFSDKRTETLAIGFRGGPWVAAGGDDVQISHRMYDELCRRRNPADVINSLMVAIRSFQHCADQWFVVPTPQELCDEARISIPRTKQDRESFANQVDTWREHLRRWGCELDYSTVRADLRPSARATQRRKHPYFDEFMNSAPRVRVPTITREQPFTEQSVDLRTWLRGRNLTVVRKRILGMSQEALDEALDYKKTMVGKVENGRKPLSESAIEIMKRLLTERGVDPTVNALATWR